MNTMRQHRLTEAEIARYQHEARKTLLGNGYNLFAEITLRLIEHYYASLAEAENVRRLRVDYQMETRCWRGKTKPCARGWSKWNANVSS